MGANSRENPRWWRKALRPPVEGRWAHRKTPPHVGTALAFRSAEDGHVTANGAGTRVARDCPRARACRAAPTRPRRRLGAGRRLDAGRALRAGDGRIRRRRARAPRRLAVAAFRQSHAGAGVGLFAGRHDHPRPAVPVRRRGAVGCLAPRRVVARSEGLARGRGPSRAAVARCSRGDRGAVSGLRRCRRGDLALAPRLGIDARGARHGAAG